MKTLVVILVIIGITETLASLGSPNIRSTPLLTYFPQNPRPQNFSSSDVGDPLFLTPFIKSGNIDEARKRARVESLSVVPSYSGFMTVNKKYGSNLFFWYFPAAYERQDAPVIVWLQGGPGGSSLFGLFVEHGPFAVGADMDLNLRATAWSIPYHVIYIDQPVGTGFSFTNNEAGYAKNQDDVARDLYEFMSQFYDMFPELAKRELYITGESYAGKYVPALSFKIHQENKMKNKRPMPLAGIAIGDGLSDPINQLDYADFMFETGLIDEKERDDLRNVAKRTKESIQKGDWKTASDLLGLGMDIFANKTGLDFYYNYLIGKEPQDFNYYVPFLDQPEVRKAIHVGNLSYDGVSMTVHEYLYEDMAKSVKPWIEELLNSDYKVMIYNGQLDVIIGYPMTENYISKLDWKRSGEYKKATRKIWRVGKAVAGYVRKVGNFYQVMVRNAGHILPYDQPKFAFDLIQRFVDGKPFSLP